MGAAAEGRARAHRAVPLRAVREERPLRGARRGFSAGAAAHSVQQPPEHGGDVLGLRHRQVDRDGELHARRAPRSRARCADRRSHRAHREGAAARRLFQHLLHPPRAGEALDQPARLARALLRGAHDRGGGGARAGHRQVHAGRRRAALRGLHRDDLRAGADAAARLLRPSGNRARAGEALSPHGRAPLSRPREVLHRRARSASRTISTRRRSRAARTRRRSITARTSTASRTSRCASSARSSGMRCARCISTARWPTSPGSSATTA